jgi:hypothetical protein
MMGNAVYLPDVDSARVLNTARAADLQVIDRATSGALLTAPSLGQLLAERGLTFFAASSGSTGSGTLMNHRGAGAGLVHHALTIPDSLAGIVEAVLGPPPPRRQGATSMPRVARAVDAILRMGLDRADADVLAAWLTQPDGTAHRTGVGSPETIEVLAQVDAEIGRLLDGLEERGVLGTTNVLVTSDHGFTTRVGQESLTDLLVNAGLKSSSDSRDVVVAGSAIHVRQGGPEQTGAIVRLLQQTDWIGPVFTRAESAGGTVGSFPGTVAFAAIGWRHDRSADILTSPTWSGAVNDHGFAGAVLSPGVASHGSTSPWDIRATLIAFGPSVRNGVATEVPTGNIDIVPTTLYFMGSQAPVELDGRVLREWLLDGPAPNAVQVVPDPIVVSAQVEGLRYELTVNRARVDATTYFSGTEVTRTH